MPNLNSKYLLLMYALARKAERGEAFIIPQLPNPLELSPTQTPLSLGQLGMFYAGVYMTQSTLPVAEQNALIYFQPILIGRYVLAQPEDWALRVSIAITLYTFAGLTTISGSGELAALGAATLIGFNDHMLKNSWILAPFQLCLLDKNDPSYRIQRRNILLNSGMLISSKILQLGGHTTSSKLVLVIYAGKSVFKYSVNLGKTYIKFLKQVYNFGFHLGSQLSRLFTKPSFLRKRQKSMCKVIEYNETEVIEYIEYNETKIQQHLKNSSIMDAEIVERK